jgi:hypothetical protein
MTPNHTNHAPTKKTQSVSQPGTERRLSDILADTRATFHSDHGKRELALLRESVRYDEPSFVFTPGCVADPLLAAFRDGRKSVIREIILRLETPEDSPEPKPPQSVK